MNRPRFAVLLALIFGAALLRLVPHPWNMTPIAAMALFGGAQFQDKKKAFFVVFAALLLSDALFGFHWAMPWVYGSFALIIGLGILLKKKTSPGRVIGFSLAGSTLFFLITNFGVWVGAPYYPQTLDGLFACYSAGIPFYRNMAIGDLFYNAVLFGTFSALQTAFPVLRAEPSLSS